MSKRIIKFIGILVFCFALSLVYQNAQAQTDAETLQPASPGEATKIGDLGSYFDEYSSYMQLTTALHSSETMHVPDMHIGGQDKGGVTFFNGTIINETTDPDTGANQPVTFGDRVRIDDYIYRDQPGTANDNRPVLFGDSVSPALDDINSLGDSERRWQYLYVSDNIYGSDIIHEENLSVTNNPTANYILSYAGNNRFAWVSVADAIDSARSSGDTVAGDTIETHHHDGSSTTTINARIEDGRTDTIAACAGAYTNVATVTFSTPYTNASSYSVTATYAPTSNPTAGQVTRPILVRKNAGTGFNLWACYDYSEYRINWHAVGN